MRQENVVNYYLLCNKLKQIIRTGWKNWHVEKERIESIAEHIYGTQMLAIAMYSEYQYDIDIYKVILMLSIHELEETVIGDITHFEISSEDKEKIGHEAVSKICSNLLSGEQIKSVIYEFDKRESKEARFAYFCDKLECDIQAKIYGDENTVDLNNQNDNISYYDNTVQKLLNEEEDFGKMWVRYGQGRYNYDDNFKEVSDYVLTHRLNSN